MSDERNPAIRTFSTELQAALSNPHRDDFIQFVGAAIRGLGVNGIIDDKLSLKVCTRMRIGEK